MDTTFEDLGLDPMLVEALAADGAEVPTELQQELLPVLLRGNSLLVRGGPGSGVATACGAGLLQGLPGELGSPLQALVLVPLRSEAVSLARSLSRLAALTGQRVAALGGPFALPELAQLLVSTPTDLLAAVGEGTITTDSVRQVVALSADALVSPESAAGLLTAIQEQLPSEEDEPVQWVVASEPVTEAVRSFVESNIKRAVHVPTDAASQGGADESPVRRGRLGLQVVEGPVDELLVRRVGELLADDGADHVLLFARSEDQVADLGDLLDLHGFSAGAPGAPDHPVWLGGDAAEVRRTLTALDDAGSWAVVSVGAPSDPDELDRRHGGGSTGVALLAARELPHLRRVAAEAGYTLTPMPEDENPAADEVADFIEAVEAAIADTDLMPWHVLLEPLVKEHGARTVAAALARELRRRGRSRGGAGPESSTASAGGPGGAGGPQAFVRLFISVGSRDGLGPGDLLGAITGESGIKGDQVGRIDLRDTFSRVDVEEGVAERVIRALNGVSIRGRSVRADFDRAGARSSGSSDGRGGGGGRGGPPARGSGPGNRSGGPRR